MARRPSRKRHSSSEDLNLIPIMNVFMIIIPFLLMTAVFAKSAVINLLLPQEKSAGALSQNLMLPLVVKAGEKGFEFEGMGQGIVVPKKDGEFDYVRFTAELIKLKDKYPEQEEIILLFAPETPYNSIVKTMDASRETDEAAKRVLFPLVSLGRC